MLSDELLARLKKGDRPSGRQVDCNALLEAAKILGFVPSALTGFPAMGLDKRNMTIDALDRDYPGWRGYRVPETEGKRDA